MKFKNRASGVVVDAQHAAGGTRYNGVRAKMGDWIVTGVTPGDNEPTLMSSYDLMENYEYILNPAPAPDAAPADGTTGGSTGDSSAKS